jgi:16S rRNA (guanine527-N7)-methyltransferase
MTEREFRDRLSRRARRVGLTVAPHLMEKLWIYFQLLHKWNQKINLTGLDLAEPTPEGLDRLLIEPLLAAQHAPGTSSLIDIGSGGGSPALPLALAMPGARLVMIEVKVRKSVFLREAARELGLDDASVETSRHETLLSNPAFHDAFDALSVRAVRVEARVFAALQSFVRPGGRILQFRTASETAPLLPPSLELLGAHGLGESNRAQLLVIAKRPERSTWNTAALGH